MRHSALFLLSVLLCLQVWCTAADYHPLSRGHGSHQLYVRHFGGSSSKRHNQFTHRWLVDRAGMSHANAIRAAPNPWVGRKLSVNPQWSQRLESTYSVFRQRKDTINAAKVRALQKMGTFVWISSMKNLPDIDRAITNARATQNSTGIRQMIGLVLYDIPGRDWNGHMSSGEFTATEKGLENYKTKLIQPFAEKIKAARDLSFAIVLEPDAIGNLVTNSDAPFRRRVAPLYERGLAYAIKSLQSSNIHLYVDVANGGWLGWNAHLQPTADVMAKILRMARQQSTNRTTIRGFATNVSNFNPFKAAIREEFTMGNNSWDESHYITTLAPYLQKAGLPLRFIVDQGRVALPGARKSWGDWANVAPAAFGAVPGSPVNNAFVDSIVWVKPAGESDGPHGYPGAPAAGVWFPQYVQMMVKNSKLPVG